MKKDILIDTNIILDFFLTRKPFDKNASEILSLCNKKHNGYVTVISISTVYYILRKVGTHQKVIKNLKKLMQLVNVVNANNEIITEALNSDFKDFEDALQYFSCKFKTNIDFIITRNIKDFKHSNISVYTPEIYLQTLNYK